LRVSDLETERCLGMSLSLPLPREVSRLVDWPAPCSRAVQLHLDEIIVRRQPHPAERGSIFAPPTKPDVGHYAVGNQIDAKSADEHDAIADRSTFGTTTRQDNQGLDGCAESPLRLDWREIALSRDRPERHRGRITDRPATNCPSFLIKIQAARISLVRHFLLTPAIGYSHAAHRDRPDDRPKLRPFRPRGDEAAKYPRNRFESSCKLPPLRCKREIPSSPPHPVAERAPILVRIRVKNLTWLRHPMPPDVDAVVPATNPREVILQQGGRRGGSDVC
jgi:hypothetical protein